MKQLSLAKGNSNKMSVPVISRSSLQICGNCRQPLQNETSKTTFQAKDFYGSTRDEIQIIDAIAYIYGISWNDFLIHTEKWSKSHPEDNFQSGQIESSLELCVLCTKLLSNNFTAHKRFENVCHPSSVVQRINTFRQHKEVRPLLELEQEVCPLTAQVQEINPRTTQESEMLDNCDSPPDNDFNDDDDLFENFYITGKEKADDEVEIEEKFVPDYNESISSKPNLKLGEDYSTSDVVTKYSLRSRQLFVKLERLPEGFKDPIDKSNERKKKRRFIKIKRRNTVKKQGPRKTLDNNSKDKTYEPSDSDSATKEHSKSKVPKERRSESKNENCECKICGKKMRSVSYYQKVHLPKHYQNVKCQFCDKMMPKRRMTKHLMNFHKEEYKKKVECPICNKMIVRYHLQHHTKVFHSGPQKTYKCDKCDKEYKNKTIYSEHILTHLENFTPHLCVMCGKTFKSASSFEFHLKRHERGKFKTRRFVCEQCPMEFVGMEALKEHRKEKHLGERSFTCQECGKSYKWKRQLVQHNKIHNELKEKGENAVKCEKCNVFLKHSLSLSKHNLRFHKDTIKVYDCSFCAQRFTCATYLRKHEKKHKDNPNFRPRKETKRVSKLFKQPDDQSENCEAEKTFIVCTLNDSNLTPTT